MMNIKTIIITCIGGALSTQFIRLIKQSSRHSFRIIGTDCFENPSARNLCDAFYTVPSGNSPDYLESIEQICRNEHADLIFPCADEEALCLAKHKETLEAAGTVVACNDFELLDIFSNKISTYKKLQEIGIDLPLWHETRSQDDILEKIELTISETGKAVVKEPCARGGRGTILIDNALTETRLFPNSREIHTNFRLFRENYLHNYNTDTQLVMECLQGPGYDLDILAWQGTSHALIPRKRVNHIVPNEGFILTEDHALIEMGQRVVRELNASWLFDIDFMTTRDGKPALLEINPRASGSLSVSLMAGASLFDDMISLLKNEPLENAQPDFGQHFYSYTAIARK
ncbi:MULTISPECIES: ATP-grasp domain-containing protein [Kiloniella]|uniref:ATP-grasp domain-containing protein n=1 Tax=Kiloniellaceae TaxID=597359 RepID=UPI0031CDB04C